MIALYSLWTPPDKRGTDFAMTHGFNYTHDHLYSLALSLCYSSKWFDEIDLHVDEWSHQFVDGLFPNVKVVPSFKSLDNLPSSMWSMAKLQTQANTARPYAHIDSDVYLFDKPDISSTDGAITFQSIEPVEQYTGHQKSMLGLGVDIPKKYIVDDNTKFFNFGITAGGMNLHESVKEVYEDAMANMEEYSKFDYAFLLIEQGWISKLIQTKGIDVHTLYDDYKRPRGYVHTMAWFKRRLCASRRVYNRLMKEFPDIARAVNIRANDRLRTLNIK